MPTRVLPDCAEALLNADDERRLAREIAEGRAARRVLDRLGRGDPRRAGPPRPAPTATADVTALLERLADPGAGPADRAVDRALAAAALRAARIGLDDRSRGALCLRFGLDGAEPLSYGEIGERLGICRESARQTCESALAILRRALGAITEGNGAIDDRCCASTGYAVPSCGPDP